MNEAKWVSRWAQPTTFLSPTYWGPQYFYDTKHVTGRGTNHVIFIHRKGYTVCYMRQDELDKFGNYLIELLEDDPDLILLMLDGARKNYDQLRSHMKVIQGRIPSQKEYQRFHRMFARQLGYHMLIKKPLEYMSETQLEEYSQHFVQARIDTEDVYSLTEQYWSALCNALGQKEKYDPQLLSCLTQGELEQYFIDGTLPEKEVLQKRFNESAIIMQDGENTIITGNAVKELEKHILPEIIQDMARGKTVYPGNVKGTVRRIDILDENATFEQGDILVTKMTDPDFLPIMKKAAAIVTDSGGSLCHAAIVARELKIPCVVGTEVATKVFKDGDIVEVDAEKGIVKRT